MAKNIDNSNVIIFWLELSVAILIPIIISWKYHYIICWYSYWNNRNQKSKSNGKYRIPTIWLSIINLSFGIIEVSILILIFYAVVFGGVTA